MATRNKMTDLRNHLFEVIEMLKDGDMDVQKADAIVGAAKAITDTAKVEIGYLRLVRDSEQPLGSDFLQGNGGIPLLQ